jgi:hypothetical protein
MQALGDERSPGSGVSLERFAQCQSQTSADVMMSHVSSRIESQGGQSRFATGVKVPMKLVHIPLHNRRAHIAPFRGCNNQTGNGASELPRQEHLSGHR